MKKQNTIIQYFCIEPYLLLCFDTPFRNIVYKGHVCLQNLNHFNFLITLSICACSLSPLCVRGILSISDSFLLDSSPCIMDAILLFYSHIFYSFCTINQFNSFSLMKYQYCMKPFSWCLPPLQLYISLQSFHHIIHISFIIVFVSVQCFAFP